jgi:transglutaminase-like putative cysteine protease
MKKNCLIACIFLLCSARALAQDYAIARIPESLKKNVHAVVREENTLFDIRSTDKATLRVHRVVSVLNEAAREELFFMQSTDQFHSLSEVTIRVFDAAGKSLRSYERSDLSKLANPFELVPDGKVYYMNVPVPSYPVTVSYDYEVKMNGLYKYPDYRIQEPGQSVERSVFTVKVPTDLDLRYREMNVQLPPEIDGQDRKIKTYTWKVDQLTARSYEDGSGAAGNSFPWISLSPNRYELDGYPGDMTSWKNMGLWYNQLVKTDNTLSPQFRTEIQQLAASASSDKEKARLIYKYLQKNFRYVSIQLGIGGFKPFAADFVHKKKYGDCKGLSNYMQACLEAVNIKSYPVWVWGDELPNQIDPAFPRADFNHQILCIPFANDTTWLECTSSTNEFGVLGSFTENRYALLLTENGGVLLKTPSSRAPENRYDSYTVVPVTESGSGQAVVIVKPSGEFRQAFISMAMDKKDEQKNAIVKRLQFQHPDAFEFSFDKDNATSAVVLKLDIEKIPDFSAGNKLFLNPRIYRIWNDPLPKTENRQRDYYLPYPQVKNDTTVYVLANGFEPETLPKDKSLQCDYGSFKTSYRYDADKKAITSIAELQVNSFTIPSSGFVAARKFFNEVLAEYNEKIVVKRL